MQSAIHVRSTVLPGKRIEITAPELAEGETVDLIISPAGAAVTPAWRRAVLGLPIAERRKILAEQVEATEDHYRNDMEWR